MLESDHNPHHILIFLLQISEFKQEFSSLVKCHRRSDAPLPFPPLLGSPPTPNTVITVNLHTLPFVSSGIRCNNAYTPFRLHLLGRGCGADLKTFDPSKVMAEVPTRTTLPCPGPFLGPRSTVITPPPPSSSTPHVQAPRAITCLASTEAGVQAPP